jgi:hypothetical protein
MTLRVDGGLAGDASTPACSIGRLQLTRRPLSGLPADPDSDSCGGRFAPWADSITMSVVRPISLPHYHREARRRINRG